MTLNNYNLSDNIYLLLKYYFFQISYNLVNFGLTTKREKSGIFANTNFIIIFVLYFISYLYKMKYSPYSIIFAVIVEIKKLIIIYKLSYIYN